MEKPKYDLLPTPAIQPAKRRVGPARDGHDADRSSTAFITCVVLSYFVVSLAVVFLNKYIMNVSEYKFPYPLFVTWFQLLVAMVILVVCGRLGQSYELFSLVPPFEFRLDIAKKVSPLTIMYVLMLAFNNLCLKYVEVTFYQIARSLTILCNIGFTYTLLGTKTSSQAVLACMIVFWGFVLGSYGEVNFSMIGLVFGLASSVFTALYGIYIKKVLPAVEGNQWRLLHYNTAISILYLGPLVLFSGELSEIREQVYFLNEPAFWTTMTITGVTGFLINIAVFAQVKYTSPLTNTISGTAKACVQTILAALYFRNPISVTNGFGIFLSLLGSSYYSFVRYREMSKR